MSTVSKTFGMCLVLVFATTWVDSPTWGQRGGLVLVLAMPSYWEVTAEDSCGTTPGEVSSFTTQDCSACSYDLNGDGYLGPEDVGEYVLLLSNYRYFGYYIWWPDPYYDPCLDANGDGYLGPEDVGAFITFLVGYASDYYYVLCDGAPLP